jgi:hypothetical protein
MGVGFDRGAALIHLGLMTAVRSHHTAESDAGTMLVPGACWAASEIELHSRLGESDVFLGLPIVFYLFFYIF